MEVSPEQQQAQRLQQSPSWFKIRQIKLPAKHKPFEGILRDFRGRVPLYACDWQEGLNCNIRILSPAVYIFLASAIPALAFGQQMSSATGGILTVVHILAATAITGSLQSVVGGQPLLIVGVSEPITLIYGYCYSFGEGKSGLGQENFLAWMAWVCVWTAVMLFLLATFNACNYTDRFTRLSGELFGMLIAVLFMQQAIKGTLEEFRVDRTPLSVSSATADEFQWRLVNGLFALFIAFGLALSALKVRQARSWRFFNQPIRSFLADYGVTVCVVFWSCLSYALKGTPQGSPRRLALPNTWRVATTWTVANKMAEIPGSYIAGALIPALLIAILFYFDHTVSAQMAQLKEFNLRKPPAYHYDLFLLGVMTLICGLIGLPPVNGVLPQAPLHTKSLITLKQQNTLAALHRAAKAHEGGQAKLLDEMAKECRKLGSNMAAETIRTSDSLAGLRGSQTFAEALIDTDHAHDVPLLIEKVAAVLPTEVEEQRVTNLIQSLLVAACLGVTPGIKKMPTSVLWGYFAYLAIESLPDSQFWERFLLIFVETKRRPPAYPGAAEAPWLGTVTWRVMIAFTVFQTVYCGMVYGITWIPIAGVIFPVPILLLIPAREHILPRIFGRKNLAALDPAPYEDKQGRPTQQACTTAADIEEGNSGAAAVNGNCITRANGGTAVRDATPANAPPLILRLSQGGTGHPDD